MIFGITHHYDVLKGHNIESIQQQSNKKQFYVCSFRPFDPAAISNIYPLSQQNALINLSYSLKLNKFSNKFQSISVQCFASFFCYNVSLSLMSFQVLFILQYSLSVSSKHIIIVWCCACHALSYIHNINNVHSPKYS